MPYIRVAAGSSVYMGTPGSSKQFIEKTKYGLGEDYYNHKRPLKKKDADGAYHESVAQAETAMQTLPSQMVQGAAEDAIVLIDAQVWPANGGDGIEVPVVRIPFAAVDGWWIGGGKKISAGGGGGWFFGVAVPLDLGD